MEKLGYPVKYFDKEANPVAKPTVQKVDASVTVASVVDKYINAIGGKANLAKITSYTTNASMSMQGQNIDFKIVKAQGGKELTTVTAMGQVVQKQVFDGKTGYSMQMGQRVDITPEEIAEKQKNPELFEELGFAKSADYKLGGIEKSEGKILMLLKVEIPPITIVLQRD